MTSSPPAAVNTTPRRSSEADGRCGPLRRARRKTTRNRKRKCCRTERPLRCWRVHFPIVAHPPDQTGPAGDGEIIAEVAFSARHHVDDLPVEVGDDQSVGTLDGAGGRGSSRTPARSTHLGRPASPPWAVGPPSQSRTLENPGVGCWSTIVEAKAGPVWKAGPAKAPPFSIPYSHSSSCGCPGSESVRTGSSGRPCRTPRRPPSLRGQQCPSDPRCLLQTEPPSPPRGAQAQGDVRTWHTGVGVKKPRCPCCTRPVEGCVNVGGVGVAAAFIEDHLWPSRPFSSETAPRTPRCRGRCCCRHRPVRTILGCGERREAETKRAKRRRRWV